MKVINKYTLETVKGNLQNGTIVSILSDILNILIKTDNLSNARLKEMELEKQITKQVKAIYDKVLSDLINKEHLVNSVAVIKLNKEQVDKFISLVKSNNKLKYRVRPNSSILKSAKTIVEVWYER